jgi:DNA topoisomerase VI subunit B
MIIYSPIELDHIAYLARHESRNKLNKYLLSKLSEVNKQMVDSVCTQIECHPKQAVFNYIKGFISIENRQEAYQEWMAAALQKAKSGCELHECIHEGNLAVSRWRTGETKWNQMK